MGNTQQFEPQNAKIQGLVGRYLELRNRDVDRDQSLDHLDQDTLTAYSEGRVSEREALPIVQHLSDCSFCRHITSELVRLDLEFVDMDEPVRVRDSSHPASVSSVLSGILSRIFGSSEAAVFAHEEPKKEDEIGEDTEDEESKE